MEWPHPIGKYSTCLQTDFHLVSLLPDYCTLATELSNSMVSLLPDYCTLAKELSNSMVSLLPDYCTLATELSNCMVSLLPDYRTLAKELSNSMVRPIKLRCCVFNRTVLDEESEWFKVKTGVKQGDVMSGFIFLMVVDWIMRSTTAGN